MANELYRFSIKDNELCKAAKKYYFTVTKNILLKEVREHTDACQLAKMLDRKAYLVRFTAEVIMFFLSTSKRLSGYLAIWDSHLLPLTFNLPFVST
jgi:hypothetical protein